MRKISLLILTVLSMSQMLAQTVQAPIVLQSGSSIRAFTSLDSAILAAITNDVLFVPTGTFILSKPITKKLFIYGNGYRPDTTGVAGISTITATSNVAFSGGNVQDTYISGISFIKQIRMDSIRSITFSRCRFQDNVTTTNSTNAVYGSICTFKDCIVKGSVASTGEAMNFGNSATALFNNCIIDITKNMISQPNGTIKLDNCIVFNNGSGFYNSSGGGGGTVIASKNIIFCAKDAFTGITTAPLYAMGQDFTNNLVYTSTINQWGNPDVDGTTNDVKDISSWSNVFIRHNGQTRYDLASDFHIQTACQCPDRGIYLGQNPFRDIPEIPWIVERGITQNGNNLQFKVRVKSGSN